MKTRFTYLLAGLIALSSWLAFGCERQESTPPPPEEQQPQNPPSPPPAP